MAEFRVYVDTSVFGGTGDEEFKGPSKRFFDRFRRGDSILLISRQTLADLNWILRLHL